MRALLVSAILVSLLAIGSLKPETQETFGAIRSIDADNRTLTLSNGAMFSMRKRIDQEALSVGEKVRVSFDAKKALNTARAVTVIQ
ncbi:DUF1344 domain-containing protein [Microbaculum marinum]|uniref:DUF1344 domain-containing protein n=1 Tax=Microbaculum marinum TaxID=1764581 RepID=A0AAW9RRX0_9HYPH